MTDIKYTDILRLNKELGESIQGDKYRVTVLSNIIVTQLNDIFEYSTRSQNINTKVTSGDYDNIMQDSIKYADSDLVIIFWEASNLLDGLQYKANLMDDNTMESFISKVKSEIDFVLSNLQKTSLVIFNKFSSLVFNHTSLKINNFDKICKELNEHLAKKVQSNILIIDIDKILAKLSVLKCVDFRYYYSSKALYTIDFYKAYSQFINPILKSVKGKAKKALIFDCDNTLWKGVVGEDGIDNIEMSGKTKGGVTFEEVQHLALDLNKRGVLIGLCSKNNPQDVEGVVNNHPEMSIRNEHITIKKVNWGDKVTNLKTIAQELNIGLDSIVFIDDSDFEVGLIKDHLPEVTVIKVPSNLYEYPKLMRDNEQFFYSISETEEDLKRIEMYKHQVLRQNEKQSFSDIESYLKSLQLEIIIHINEKSAIPRIAQMTQKTNQFNLTTKRYTEADIAHFINSKEFITLAFEVKDRYGDSGITGISILKMDTNGKNAIIDTLLMSCRVIGRNIEIAFFDFLINYLKNTGIESLDGRYIKTLKNEQVSSFYEKLNFTCTENSENEKIYTLELKDYIFQNINYIKVNHGRKN